MAISTDEVHQMIVDALPGAEVEVSTRPGRRTTSATVTAPQFSGLSRIEQHKLVKKAAIAVDDGSIHALSIKTSVPSSGLRMIVRGARPLAPRRQPDDHEPSLKDRVEELIRENKVLLFMKGTRRSPAAASRCGS